MAQQNLKTVITIGGHVDNTFGRLGDSLTALGSQVDQVSQKIISFGKDSVQTYVRYDDAMRETQAVGGYTTAEMERLDALNRKIAQTSTYTNLQSANAMVLVAQAGMKVADVEVLLPEILDLAMAGNLELADSTDYLISSLQALGYEMDYADELVDQMAKTASIGMTDIDTLGESLMRLGSGAQMFKGGSVEILSILSAMSQFGHDQRGSQGGTWLRNFMLSLAAPAGSINDIVDAMEQLGIAQEEIDQYAEDHGTGVAAMAVESLVEDGLRIYDEKGKLLPAIDIIKSLRDTVLGSGEYSEDLLQLTGMLNEAGGDLDAFVKKTDGLTDNALYNVFAKIFGKRGITTALNLISISDDEWAQIIGDVQNSDGFAESMSEIMQGGLGGALREFEATWTELKTTLGEVVAPDVQGVAGFLHDSAVAISTLDEAKLSALVGGMEGLAAVGPGLVLAGGAVKLIGFALTPAGSWALGLSGAAIAAGALIKYLDKLDEIEFESNFGEMDLDKDSLIAHVGKIEEAFKASYTEVDKYATALATAVTNYETASTTLSGDLLTAMITGTTLTEAQITNIKGLGTAMGNELLAGISASFDQSASYLTMLYGGLEAASEDSDYAGAIMLADSMYQSLVGEAERLGQEFGKTLGAAMDDGIVTGDEYNAIMEKMQAYNDAIAFAARADQAAKTAQQLHKAQSVSWDSASGFLSEQAVMMDATLAEEEMAFIGQWAWWESVYDDAIRRAGTEEEAARLQEEKLSLLGDEDTKGSFVENYEARIKGFQDENAQIQWAVVDALMGQSDYGVAWQYLRNIYEKGGLNLDADGTLRDDFDYFESFLPEGTTLDEVGQNIAELSKKSGKTLKEFEKILPDDIYWVLESIMDKDVMEMLSDHQLSYAQAHSGDYDDIFSAIASGDEKAYITAWNLMDRKARQKYESLVNDIEQYYDLDSLLSGDAHIFAQNGSAYRHEYAAYKLLFEQPLNMQASITGLYESAVDERTASQEYFDDNPGTYNVNVKFRGGASFQPLPLFAEGGRADEPSIFGEAGAEWAIPEEHTANTASLIWKAAQASGFTWDDIAEANGDSGASKGGNTLVYSPTIIAADATGVAEKLREDKENLERWLRERELMDKITVYS